MVNDAPEGASHLVEVVQQDEPGVAFDRSKTVTRNNESLSSVFE
jgi:hypothetical protein